MQVPRPGTLPEGDAAVPSAPPLEEKGRECGQPGFGVLADWIM